MIGSDMENLVRWTIVGLELAALGAIAGGFLWSAVKSIVVYVRSGMADESKRRAGLSPRSAGRNH